MNTWIPSPFVWTSSGTTEVLNLSPPTSGVWYSSLGRLPVGRLRSIARARNSTRSRNSIMCPLSHLSSPTVLSVVSACSAWFPSLLQTSMNPSAICFGSIVADPAVIAVRAKGA